MDKLGNILAKGYLTPYYFLASNSEAWTTLSYLENTSTEFFHGTSQLADGPESMLVIFSKTLTWISPRLVLSVSMPINSDEKLV